MKLESDLRSQVRATIAGCGVVQTFCLKELIYSSHPMTGDGDKFAPASVAQQRGVPASRAELYRTERLVATMPRCGLRDQDDPIKLRFAFAAGLGAVVGESVRPGC